MDNLKDSVKEVMKERLSNPLWGYIALSWVAFNWKNLAILFFSKEKVEDRLYFITNQDGLYFYYLIIPVLFGMVLASLSPYLKWVLAKAHEFGESMLNEVEKKRILSDYQKDIDTVNKRIERDYASSLAEAERKKEIAEIEETQKQLPFQTEALKKKYEKLEKDIKELEILQSKLLYENENLNSKVLELTLVANNIIKICKDYYKVSNSESLASYMNKIKDIMIGSALLEPGVLNEEESNISLIKSENKIKADILNSIKILCNYYIEPFNEKVNSDFYSSLNYLRTLNPKSEDTKKMLYQTIRAFDVKQPVKNIDTELDKLDSIIANTDFTNENLKKFSLIIRKTIEQIRKVELKKVKEIEKTFR